MEKKITMHTTYHLSSAQEMDYHIIEAIKIEESFEENDFEMSDEIKNILDNRLHEDSAVYLTKDESINNLRTKYGV